MDANEFLSDFESRLRKRLVSIDMFRMRPANNDLLMSFNDVEDLTAAVRSASSVNIAVEIGWLFEPGKPEQPGIERCFLRFQLSNGCVDERLSFFLDDLALQKHQRRGS